MKIPCKKLRENAILPTRGTALAAGVDLYALLPDGQESAAVAPQGKYLFPTGIAVEIPEGYVGLVFARSGIATKRQLAPANCVGVIDADYRGELPGVSAEQRHRDADRGKRRAHRAARHHAVS